MNQKERPCPVFTESGERFYRAHHELVRDVARIARQCAEGFKEFHHSEFMRLACNALSNLSTPQPEASDREIADALIWELLGVDGHQWQADKIAASYATIRADERLKADTERCTWTEESGPDYSGVWDTSCGKAFVYEEGTPTENGARFCKHCGKPLEFKPYIPDEDDLS